MLLTRQPLNSLPGQELDVLKPDQRLGTTSSMAGCELERGGAAAMGWGRLLSSLLSNTVKNREIRVK